MPSRHSHRRVTNKPSALFKDSSSIFCFLKKKKKIVISRQVLDRGESNVPGPPASVHPLSKDFSRRSDTKAVAYNGLGF